MAQRSYTSRAANSAHRPVASPLAIVDAGLAGLVILAPLVLGGRYAIGQLVYAALCCAIAIAWSFHRATTANKPWRPHLLEYLAAGGIALLLLQVTPLPAAWVTAFHRGVSEKLPLWFATAESEFALGQWRTLSLVPAETARGLAVFIAIALLLHVGLQRFQTVRDARQLIKWQVMGVTLLAVLGLAQYFSGTHLFLWIYEHPFRPTIGASNAVTGPFYNNNHFAHMLALGVGPLLASLIAAWNAERPKRGNSWTNAAGRASPQTWLWYAAALLLVGLAGVLSTSRGGLLAMFAALFIASGWLTLKQLLPWRVTAALAVVGLLLGIALVIHGGDRLLAQVSELTTAKVEELDKAGMRRAVWSANCAAIPSFPLVGIGSGAHRFVLPAYLQSAHALEFTHAESGYLQILTESGVAGGVLLVVALVAFGFAAWKNFRSEAKEKTTLVLAALAASLGASLLHSVWDFVWYIPASLTWGVLSLAAWVSLARTQQQDAVAAAWRPAEPLPGGLFRWLPTAVTSLAALWCIATLWPAAAASPAWDAYLRTSVAIREADRAAQRNPAESSAAQAVDARLHRIAQVDAMLKDLQQVLQCNPTDSRAHARMAGQLLVRFELGQADAANQMPLSQIRDAAQASQFKSSQDLQAWLTRAIGPQRLLLQKALAHSLRAVQLDPHCGEAYTFLADLTFLQLGDAVRTKQFLDQALAVRPSDGDTLIRCGTHAFLNRDPETAAELWKKAFQLGKVPRNKLLDSLVGSLPVGWIVEMFEPDFETMQLIEWRLGKMGQGEQLITLRQRMLAKVQAELAHGKLPSSHQAEYAGHAFQLARKLSQPAVAITAGRQLVRLRQQDEATRLAVGQYLLSQGHFSEAEQHLRWCLQRRSGDDRLIRLVERAVAGRIRAANSPTQPWQ